ncbi:MAG: bifunctional tetrahydrofolate synthase/dihydrofolate synthase [Gammaproteobacteria bacterium]|nr:bifunctional tetrahydrofolate synthase/dihydrofolate synthase [Gammaproteobacteria bacterium]
MQRVASPLNDWLARLETFSPEEIVLGLERVELVLGRLDLDLPGTVFHIAGTNGKGSSAAMLESLLRATGSRVGTYTSPHIRRYNERIRVDAREATDAQIIAAFAAIEAVRDDVPLTYFEFGTLAALVVFADANVDMAILEVGMGGRLDAVNAVTPTAGLITNIALDHCAWLGTDVEAIALEKAGIMRADTPVVFASRQRPTGIDAQAQAVGARLIAAGRDYDWSLQRRNWSWRGMAHRLARLDRPSLPGDVQIENAAGVLALLEAAGLDRLLRESIVNAALGMLRLNGRMQSVPGDRNWLLDVAHNPAAAAVLGDTLRAMPVSGRTIAIIGMLDDKDVEGVLAGFGDTVDYWIATTADSPRAIVASELARRAANAMNKACLVADSLQQALRHARSLAGPEDRILVTGSFYVVAPVLEMIAPS